MKIFVDSREAVLKKNFSFEYVSENRLFLGRDGYTLNITFPIADCPENIAIFGHITRKDISKKRVSFPCAIIDKSISLFGTLAVTKISDTEIECQFAEGRCAQTVDDPWAEVYINELDLGEQPSSGSFTPEQAWRGHVGNQNEVALPWINDDSPTSFNNWVVNQDDQYYWDKNIYMDGALTTAPMRSVEAKYLSWQPYLINIARKICDAIGYTCDFSEWVASPLYDLIICNSLPYTWDEDGMRNYRYILPHWTVTEFFEKLELFLLGEFDFDHGAKNVTFAFSSTILDQIQPVELHTVVDSYDAEISSDNEQCEYLGSKRIAYKSCDHPMQPYYACDWFFRHRAVVAYDNVQALIEANKRRIIGRWEFRDRNIWAYGEGPSLTMPDDVVFNRPVVDEHVDYVMYARQEDTLFIFRSVGRHADTNWRNAQKYVLQPVNLFGSGSEESDDVETVELDFVPACVSDTFISEKDDKGDMLYLKFSSYEDDSSRDIDESSTKTYQTLPATLIEAGDDQDKSDSAYYEVIYVGFWTGIFPPGIKPFPILDYVTVTSDWDYFPMPGCDLRLMSPSRSVIDNLPAIDPKQKFNFSWLSDTMPNPRAIFFINGKRYVCEKITATFTENGMSQLLKGEFYPLLEED